MITGKKVNLKEVEEKDLPILLKYRNNPDFRKYYREYRVLNLQNKLDWWKDKICNDDSWQFFVVTPHQEPDKVIGSVGLTYIHPVYKSGEFSLTIGDEDYRGGGYGSDALRTLIKYGFEDSVSSTDDCLNIKFERISLLFFSIFFKLISYILLSEISRLSS